MWFERFLQAIEADGRGMINISLEAGCGRNYIQQIVKYGKRPTIDKLMAILNVLGGAHAMYVLTGMEVTEEDAELFHLLVQASEEDKKAFLSLLRSRQNKTP